MDYQLTSDVSRRLQTASDYAILVFGPTVKVVELVAEPEANICGFTVAYKATIIDGDGATADVFLPKGYRPSSAVIGGTIPRLEAESVVIIQRMLRLPKDNGSIILVHDLELVRPDMPALQCVSYDEKIRALEGELRTERSFREQIEANVAKLMEAEGELPEKAKVAAQNLIELARKWIELMDGVMDGIEQSKEPVPMDI